MARDECDREDLMQEAVALADRIEFQIPENLESVIVGFRRNGAVSLYFGQDEVFQFNDRGQLRRAYLVGTMLKADDGRLVSLRRFRTQFESQLRSADLDELQTDQLKEHVRNKILGLRAAIANGTARVVRRETSIAGDMDLSARTAEWIDGLPDSVEIAAVPNVAGRMRRN
jgi:hypothetical protein